MHLRVPLANWTVVIVRFDGDMLYLAAEQHGHQSVTGFVIGDDFGHGVSVLCSAILDDGDRETAIPVRHTGRCTR